MQLTTLVLLATSFSAVCLAVRTSLPIRVSHTDLPVGASKQPYRP
jgi:hypothetical protein